jgi:hypothetical protein
MAIITKPVGGIFKGVPATITLNKSELSALASVSADSYFSITTNWNKIILSYKSSEGNQQEIVEFNATLSSPTGFFDVSLKARDFFEIQVIKIIDFDGDIFIIPRSELTTSDFDVEFEEQPPVVEGDAIVWQNTSSGYLIEEDGGVTTTIARLTGPFYDTVYGSSAGYVTGDFTYTAIISTSLQEGSLVGFYDSTTSPVYNTIVKGGTSTLGLYLTGNWNNGNPQYTIPKPQGETFEFKITRVGTLVKLFINGIEQASNNSTTISHLKIPFFTLRPNDYIISATVESEIIDEFWDVANKSGVGTVSVGANRLITKTSGGGSYDVNVLSLETITGDGYIEFPNSSLLNIGNSGVSVIGLAEQTSPNGGFQNIILGAFTVSNNWERVVNGSISGVISATNPNDIVRIGRIGTEYYIKINDVIKTQVTINNTNPLKASISLMTIGTGVDNITVESAEVPVGDPIIWDLFLNGATTEADGGLIGASTAAYSFTKSNASKIDNGADFKITYKFTDLVADWVHGISSVLTEESQSQFNFTGLTYQQSALISYYRGVQQPNQSLSILNSPGENTLVIEKTGTNLIFTLNNTVVLSKTDYTEQLTVPAVRPWNVRALDSAYVEIQEAVVGDPILWQSKPGYIIEADGGATATSERPSYGEYYRVFAPSSQWVTGDFTFEAEINNTWQGNDYIGFYESDTNFTLTTGFNGSQVRYEQTTPASYVKPAGDTYTVKMQRIGFVLKFYVNDVEVYSVTQTNLSTVKVPFFTFTDSVKHIVSATIILPEAGDYITYNLDGYTTPATKNAFGGVSGGVYTANSDVAVKSSVDAASGDFDYEWKLDWSSATSISNMFVGVTGNDIVNGTSFYPNLTCLYGSSNNPDIATLWHNGQSGITNLTLLNDVNMK